MVDKSELTWNQLCNKKSIFEDISGTFKAQTFLTNLELRLSFFLWKFSKGVSTLKLTGEFEIKEGVDHRIRWFRGDTY